MKTTIATVMTVFLVLGGLAWAQMETGKGRGMMGQQSTAAESEAGATPGASQRPMQGMPGMMGNMLGNMMGSMMGNMMRSDAQNDVPFIQNLLQQREQLNLTPQQIQQLQALVNDTRKALIRDKAEIEIAELDLKALMQAEPIDMTQVQEIIQRQEAKGAEMRLARLNAIASAKGLLTPEQRQQAALQPAATSQARKMMGCSMMGNMMGQQSGT